MKSSPVLLAALLCAPLLSTSAFANGDDNFEGNSKNNANWGTDVVTGNGAMDDAGSRLNYKCASGTLEDQVDRPWIRTRLPYNSDWDMQIDLYNTTSPVSPFQVNSMGITLESPLSSDTTLYHEFYNSALGAPPARTGFSAQMDVAGTHVGGGDSGGPQGNSGAVRLHWNASSQTVTAYYDIDPSDGYQWISLGSFGLGAAGGGTLANGDWGMASTDQFFFSIYGYSSAMSVAVGQMEFNNFSETGGVAGGGGTRPAPTGSFRFPFPLGNDLLTRIASFTGNYKGTSPVVPARSYDLDVAQDESGKVMGMGTVDGVQDSGGNSDLSMNLGRVRTVNGEPVAETKSSFKGTADGMEASFKSNGTYVAELVDVGAPYEGVTGTSSYSGKANGIPFSGQNEPFEFEAPPGTEDNLKQAWSIDLELEERTVNGKVSIFASAILTRPDGDVIVFPEKVVKFSQTKGYNLKFKKGTNVTANPDTIDAKSSVTFTGLDFEENGGVLEASAGTINYKFLGQSGTANVTDFLAP
ncbi:hypothetical protein [Luteolibacter soli]|uniref:Transferrin-binding protein B C-lobe/N-lobe beta barrel domain-containing protein n=1 Tax=Luteolibacter soli TaxID=3135280 RepID=A0ABU9B105_9BACT